MTKRCLSGGEGRKGSYACRVVEGGGKKGLETKVGTASEIGRDLSFLLLVCNYLPSSLLSHVDNYLLSFEVIYTGSH